MKKIAMCVLFLALAAAPAFAVTVGVGAYGGSSFPIVQDDNGQGTMFGVRVPVGFTPMLFVEPYGQMTTGGDVDETINTIPLTRSGIDLTSYGANLMFKFGKDVIFAPFAGLGMTHSERDGLDQDSMQYSFGLGLEFVPFRVPLHLDLRGEYQSVLDEDVSSTARNYANATLGATYYFLTK